MKRLEEQGVIFVRLVDDAGVESYAAVYKGETIVPPSKAQELRKELRKTWNKKGDDLVRELDEIKRINLSKTGTGGVFKYIEENTSIRILCQEKAMSCSAACVRQIISDYKGKNISENSSEELH